MIGDETIRLFQRGNALANAAERALDGTADLSWRALAARLADPEAVAPPAPRNI